MIPGHYNPAPVAMRPFYWGGDYNQRAIEMKVGLYGIPGAGATTLFCIFAQREYSKVQMSGKVEVHLGETRVPDPRVDALAEIFNPEKITYPVIEFVDVPVELEHSGAYTPTTVNTLRSVDALALVIRAFDNPAVPHPKETIDPLRDMKAACEEAILTDLIQVEKRLEKLKKEGQLKGQEAQIFLKLKDHLEAMEPVRNMELPPDMKKIISGFKFLTEKQWLILLNTDPDDSIDTTATRKFLDENDFPWLRMSAQMELEIADLPLEEREEFYKDLGVDTGARDRFIRGCYEYLDLISFLTEGSDECRAWSIKNGSDAVTAAGKIHADLARGFIRAEVVSFEDFMAAGSLAGAKKAGKVRLEGKHYIVKDGDIMSVRFSV